MSKQEPIRLDAGPNEQEAHKASLLKESTDKANGSAKEDTDVTARDSGLRYTLTQIPPIPVTLSVAMQHVLVSLASALTMSSVISDTVCASPGHSIRARLFATTLCMQGLCTITMTLIGVRLPVFQGPSSSFLVPLLALSQQSTWACHNSDQEQSPSHNGHGVSVAENSTAWSNMTINGSVTHLLTMEEKLQELSGSLMVASLVEVVVGGVGLIRPLLRYIGPLTVAPTIALIGLSLHPLPSMYAKYNPAVALGSAALVVVFSLYMAKVQVTVPRCGKGGNRTSMPIFQLLPILLAMVVMWGLCAVLTLTNVFPDDSRHHYYLSRTDAKAAIISNTPWFYFPYPGQFGPPSFNVAATVGFTAAVISSFVESVGDYYAAARCCQVRPPPDHAVTRGILVEGLGSLLSGAVGAAHATTSYSGNIAMLSLTKTASRSVLVLAGAILIVLSAIGKVGATMATLPPPILGGILLVVLGLLASLGMSTLKYADMTCNRNLLVTGVAFMAGFTVPHFVENHGDMLATGSESADQVIRVVLGTPMFLGGMVALFLDNTVPGTDEERGLASWKESHSTEDEDQGDFPISVKSHTIVVSGNSASCDVPLTGGSDVDFEDDVYAFPCLEGKLSGSFWRFVPFLPPSAIRQRVLIDK